MYVALTMSKMKKILFGFRIDNSHALSIRFLEEARMVLLFVSAPVRPKRVQGPGNGLVSVYWMNKGMNSEII